MLILFLLCFRFVSFNGYISSQKKALRAQLITKADARDLIHLKMKRSSLYQNTGILEWKENGRELVIDGLYHEVIAVKFCGDLAEVCLIEDKAENRLFAQFFSIEKDNGKHFAELSGALLSLVYLDYEKPVIRCWSQPFCHALLRPGDLCSGFLNTAGPPPRT